MPFQLTSRRASSLVGLDIEAGSIAAAEVGVNGSPKLLKSAIVPLPSGVARDGEVADPDALATSLKQMWAEQKLSRRVRVGVANQRVVVRTMRLPQIEDDDELEAAIRFQAPEQIPMPLEQAVIDWQVVARGTGEDGRQMDVVVVAARRESTSGLASCLRAAGLQPVGIDVSAFGMIRALAEAEVPDPVDYEQRIGELGSSEAEDAPPPVNARLLCSVGDATNLAVVKGETCLFTRVSSFGMEGIAQRLAERRQLTLEHARQWIAHVGLETPVESIEGDPEVVAATREVLAEGAAKLADELRLSLDFYGAQEDAVAVEQIVACGPGTGIEGLPARLERELGLPFRTERPAALEHLDPSAAARLTVSYGLALGG
jgi:type IV pilus assembly protein PilM